MKQRLPDLGDSAWRGLVSYRSQSIQRMNKSNIEIDAGQTQGQISKEHICSDVQCQEKEDNPWWGACQEKAASIKNNTSKADGIAKFPWTNLGDSENEETPKLLMW
ncbi:hypothetical protein QJS04_geneDACA016572 [Acorus gramineus]|uniref:Prolactin receptor n=1 Tax=Acorus gramineus TaxID=55184 RepID=A0AAV9BQU3_ACOGR|nr:hypothetical protein QJS04_geneDACA016572 [Acorus gramineus]